MKDVERFDAVWDVYKTNSLKKTSCKKRGIGNRRKVQPSVFLLSWEILPRVDENKTELYHYIAEVIQSTLFQNAENKQIATTSGDKVLSSVEVLMENISPCNHEEANYRVILHARHVASTGMKTVMISTSDTDVVVIAIGMFSQLLLDELWIEFGTGKHLRYIPIHQLAANLGGDKSKKFFFHAFMDATRSHHLLELENRRHGIHGRTALLLRKAVNTHRTDVTENPQIDDVILKIFVLHMYLSTAFCKLN